VSFQDVCEVGDAERGRIHVRAGSAIRPRRATD
jgi:hypothetical protein